MPDEKTATGYYSLLGKVEGAEKAFLAGWRSREADLESAVTFFLEFLRGFESFDFRAPCVTVFGSARFPEGHRYYGLARTLGATLARAGYAVMTGGGPTAPTPSRMRYERSTPAALERGDPIRGGWNLPSLRRGGRRSTSAVLPRAWTVPGCGGSRLLPEELLQLVKLLRLLVRRVVGLGEVLGDVVELPLVVVDVDGLGDGDPRRDGRRGGRDPAVVVDRAVRAGGSGDLGRSAQAVARRRVAVEIGAAIGCQPLLRLRLCRAALPGADAFLVGAVFGLLVLVVEEAAEQAGASADAAPMPALPAMAPMAAPAAAPPTVPVAARRWVSDMVAHPVSDATRTSAMTPRERVTWVVRIAASYFLCLCLLGACVGLIWAHGNDWTR
jgi:hypothetical protein